MTAATAWIPRDAAALAAGADDVVRTLAALAAERGLPLNLVRNGSRGLLWLEPLLEVATPAGRVAFGPLQADDVAGLVDAGLLAPLLPSAGAPAGHLTAGAADELGLPAGIPVAAGAGDTAAAALGSGIGLGDVPLTVGPGPQVLRPLAAPARRARWRVERPSRRSPAAIPPTRPPCSSRARICSCARDSRRRP